MAKLNPKGGRDPEAIGGRKRWRVRFPVRRICWCWPASTLPQADPLTLFDRARLFSALRRDEEVGAALVLLLKRVAGRARPRWERTG